MMTDYIPVDCGLYSEYELAILHGGRYRVFWCTPAGQLHMEVLKPCDLQSRNHEEFLIAENLNGQQRLLRLDYLLKMQAI